MRSAALLLLLVCAGWAQVSKPEQLFREAVAAQQRGDDATAIAKYKEVLKLRPDIVEVRANLGAALARQGRLDEAIQQYRAALAGKAPNPALRLNLALALYKKGDFGAAAKELEMLDRGDARIATLLGDCYVRQGQAAKAIALLAPLESAQPDDLALASIFGSALVHAGRKRDGLVRIDKVARRSGNADAWLLAGQTALALDEFEMARDDAEAALRADPKLPGAQTLLGTALQYLGDNPGAIAALKKAIEANPADFDAHLTLGAVLNVERDLDAAEQHLQRAVELDARSSLARYSLARVQRSQGKLDVAIRNFEIVVRDTPDWPQPHVELAALYFRAQRPEDGERERAIFDRLSAAEQKKALGSVRR